ncbi:hypothetical protein F0562_003763 [Nyssa sinensis]|uniref:ZF-HD dimerization-type domain-containing protein n=1 Tax=Nyssa sinensis TaxID=561372 RepID=A0A5J5BW79_9ASTE|nr:hypothetical protein F0562_003763 [Nyssa sinensis]
MSTPTLTRKTTREGNNFDDDSGDYEPASKSLQFLARTNQKSSLELSSNIVSTVRNEAGRGRIIFNPTQTLDQLHHHHDHQQQLISLQQQEGTQRPARVPNPDPDPVLAASATIAGASDLKTTTPPPPPPPPPPQPQPTTLPTNSTASIQYRECLKNHAASMGGHVLDGCGEFMPSGEEGTPGALKCAACDCHRNFHRKEADGESQPGANCYFTYNPNRNIGHRTTIYSAHATPSLPPPPPEHHHKYSHGFCHGLSTSQSAGPIPQAMMAAFGGNSRAPAESSSEDLNIFHSNAWRATVGTTIVFAV